MGPTALAVYETELAHERCRLDYARGKCTLSCQAHQVCTSSLSRIASQGRTRTRQGLSPGVSIESAQKSKQLTHEESYDDKCSEVLGRRESHGQDTPNNLCQWDLHNALGRLGGCICYGRRTHIDGRILVINMLAMDH